MFTFEPFHIWFITKHHSKKKEDVHKEINVSPTTARKIWKDRFPVTTDIIDKICDTYHLELHEVIRRRTPEEIAKIQNETNQ